MTRSARLSGCRPVRTRPSRSLSSTGRGAGADLPPPNQDAGDAVKNPRDAAAARTMPVPLVLVLVLVLGAAPRARRRRTGRDRHLMAALQSANEVGVVWVA